MKKVKPAAKPMKRVAKKITKKKVAKKDDGIALLTKWQVDVVTKCFMDKTAKAIYKFSKDTSMPKEMMQKMLEDAPNAAEHIVEDINTAIAWEIAKKEILK